VQIFDNTFGYDMLSLKPDNTAVFYTGIPHRISRCAHAENLQHLSGRVFSRHIRPAWYSDSIVCVYSPKDRIIAAQAGRVLST